MKSIFKLTMAGIVVISAAQSTMAQVAPDATLPTSVTSPNNLNFTIDGGARSGNNLFHSFSQFSVPTNGSAIFNNASDVQNIFSRVTGGAVSSIDGLIQTNGTANLFLLNPSGLLFGPNAQLNIGGSFLGSTASSIKFADNTEFSTSNPTALLTMSVPIGLQLGTLAGAITVQGQGHQLTGSSYYASIDRPAVTPGLAVREGQTLALIGNGIQLDGGVLTAESGQIELGSVASGAVTMNGVGSHWQLQYPTATAFSKIDITNHSLLDISGNGGGSIQVQGQDIRFSQGSLLFAQNTGSQAMGPLKIQAIGSVSFLGMSADELVGSGMLSEADYIGTGSNLILIADRFVADSGAQVLTRSYGEGRGGNILIDTREQIQLIGLSPVTRTTTNIVTNNFAAGASGKIDIASRSIVASQGGYIGSAPFPKAAGRAGDINVRAEELEFSGIDPITKQTSGMGTISFGLGDAGNMTINTQRLRILDGSIVDTSTYAFGEGGRLEVNASESITIDGHPSGVRLPSFLGSQAPIVTAELQALFGLPPAPTGNPGSVVVNTNALIIRNGGSLSVESDAAGGSAGSIQVNARSINLNQQGQISAVTVSGAGGNISLTADIVQMRQGSGIITNAGGGGNGGNISIQSPIVLGIENSDISANAQQGRGGNIQITTQSILGLKFRDRLTPDNDITASSEFGVNGTVQVNNIGVDPASGLLELPVDIIDPIQQVAQTCTINQGSSFVITGRGGVPKNPSQNFNTERPWQDLRTLKTEGKATISRSLPSPLIEATNWQRNAHGAVEILASNSRSSTPQTMANCATY